MTSLDKLERVDMVGYLLVCTYKGVDVCVF